MEHWVLIVLLGGETMTHEEIIAKLLERYAGLRVEDLSECNEEYSCVICAVEDCSKVGKPGLAGPCHEKCTEEQFALRYNFEDSAAFVGDI